VATSRKKGSSSSGNDGKRLLYRLLLIAVSVVYALVFILDYVLQLRFTYYLLISLFGFILFTLFYMWFKVTGKSREKDLDDAPQDDGTINQQSPFAAAIDPMDWPEAVFVVNARTGLTIAANPAAVKLFEADDASQLTGIDLTSLFAKPWSAEANKSFRDQLQSGKSATGKAEFKSLRHNVFKGVLQADKIERDGRPALLVRIHDAARMALVDPVESLKPSADSISRMFDEGGFPMVHVGIDYTIRAANRAFTNLLAYKPDELNGMSLFDIIHPEEQEQERRVLSQLFRGEISLSKRDKRFVRRTNEVIWVNLSSSLTRDEKGRPTFIITMADNVTQRKRTEQSIRDNRNRLYDLIESKEYSILSIDRHHTLLLVNSRIADVFYGLTGVVLETGFNLLDLLPVRFRNDYLEIHKKAFEGESQVIERAIELPKGINHIELVVSPVKDANGKVTSVSLFAHDITSRKQSESELLTARQKAEASTEAKTSFLATMSHEIRTPLNGVIGMGKLLNQTQLSSKQQEYVDSILLSGEALLSVINDILDISKIESSRMELEKRPFAVKRCIEETFELLSAKAIEKKLTLQYAIAPGTPAFILGDITRLRQILMNLVSNAIKFTQRGGVLIQVSKSQEVSQQIQLLVEVKDTGIGIPADRIDRLFKSYSQTDSSTARNYGGTGLGLAICKNLVELMGGTIWVKSKVGEGSTFSFTMKTEHVLIVSDDRTDADTYAEYFRRWHMKPHVTLDPRHSEQYIGGADHYHLVLIDAQMISINPMLVAEAIRSKSPKDKLPIVFFNADQKGEMIFNYTSDVISAIIPKYVDRSKVLDILIGVFSIEDHQRARHDEGLKLIGAKLAQSIPARILIAEDNQINQKLALNIFEGLGYHPVMVSNGLEVIDRLRNEEFDLIFMDVQMPELDGLDATRFILNKMGLVKVPYIIAMTAFALEGDKEKCIAAGMSDYISKPFMIEEIIDKIRSWKGDDVEIGMAAAAAISPAEKPIIDQNILNRLRELTDGDDSGFFLKVIAMFVDQSVQVVERIEQETAANNLKEASAQAHKLKGSALNIGAMRLADVCKQFEIQAREGEGRGLPELFVRLKQEAVSSRDTLGKLLQL
jgi:PAS domain S-box-containing protein